MTISKRITNLESRNPEAPGRTHRIVQHPGQSRDDALRHHLDHIAPGDRVIVRTIT